MNKQKSSKFFLVFKGAVSQDFLAFFYVKNRTHLGP